MYWLPGSYLSKVKVRGSSSVFSLRRCKWASCLCLKQRSNQSSSYYWARRRCDWIRIKSESARRRRRRWNGLITCVQLSVFTRRTNRGLLDRTSRSPRDCKLTGCSFDPQILIQMLWGLSNSLVWLRSFKCRPDQLSGVAWDGEGGFILQ